MKKFLFSVCSALAILGCGGDMNNLPPIDGDGSNCSANFRTVTIGTQTWMAENLNCDVSGSKCYDDDPANCEKYGRFYDWSTAMNLPSSCNENSCSNQIQSKHRGICPSGWHIPSDDDWNVLMDYVGGSSTAGTKLKSTTGWNNNGNGTDQYGFSALPDGIGGSGGGEYGFWWSAHENDSDSAYFRFMGSHYDAAVRMHFSKSLLFSVRCIRDGDEKYSSPSVRSSSSLASSSSSPVGYTGSYGSVYYEGQAYKTVAIGAQTWMAENLNYAVAGSKCIGEGGEVLIDWDEDGNPITKTLSGTEVQINCVKYGRLYNWSTAMALPSSCNSNSCSNQIQSKHRGICPSGWHIPSYDDWDRLMNYVGGSSTAGIYLKSTSGWNGGGNGTDQYGFSALPGGFGYSGGSFDGVGGSGLWWSADASGSDGAYSRLMYYSDDYADWYYIGKSILFSVRCVQDGDERPSSSSVRSSSSLVSSSSSSVPSSSSLVLSSSSFVGYTGSYGSIYYEGQAYKTVAIGTQTWLAENLNYNASNSKCYDNDPANCTKYGRLYDWSTAMSLPSSCNSNSCSSQIQSKHRGICPSGWHIPSNDDWDKLFRYVDNVSGSGLYYSPTAGRYLKSTTGWSNGTDQYGFSALPGGYGYSDGSFPIVCYDGYWWSASEFEIDSYFAYYRGMYYYDYDGDNAGWLNDGKSGLFSVRCLQD